MGKSIEEISNKAFEQGRKYEKECTGCAQTTIAGIFDALGIDNEDVFKAASGLADGLGLTGNGTCGSLMGGAIVIGYLFGRERKDFADMMKPLKSYILSKKLHDEFVEKYGLDELGLLLDAFHMNIEDVSIEGSIKKAGKRLEHFHSPDSNRLAVGWGHLDYDNILKALDETGYGGYLMVEAFPKPDALSCAVQSAKFFREKVPSLKR